MDIEVVQQWFILYQWCVTNTPVQMC